LRVAYASAAIAFPWALVDALPSAAEVSAGGETLRSGPITPEEDAAVERALGLLEGQLAEARARAGRVFLQVQTTASIVAACVFDPKFPGAAPFRARDLKAAAVLLRAARPHALTEGMAVVIEDHPALRDALVARGATVCLESVHMRGPLPV
jgi:hypothetical protein